MILPTPFTAVFPQHIFNGTRRLRWVEHRCNAAKTHGNTVTLPGSLMPTHKLTDLFVEADL